MSDSLSAFIVTAVEFIIGGLMVLVALVFVASSYDWSMLEFYHGLRGAIHTTSGFGALVILLAFAYPLGIVSESVSRALTERDLVRITVDHPRFGTEPVPADRRTSHPKKRPARPRDGLTAWLIWAIPPMSWPRSPEDIEARVNERERQRAASIAKHELYLDVDSQLKRLRLERMTLLATLIVVPGFIIRSGVEFHERGLTSWPWVGLLALGIVGIATTCGLLLLVHSRFSRYCDAIARAYEQYEIAAKASSGSSAL